MNHEGRACFSMLLALLPLPALAGEVTFSDTAVVERPSAGEKIVTTRVENASGEKRSVNVTSGGVVYNAGELEAGESARVHVIERQGSGPVIILDRESR